MSSVGKKAAKCKSFKCKKAQHNEFYTKKMEKKREEKRKKIKWWGWGVEYVKAAVRGGGITTPPSGAGRTAARAARGGCPLLSERSTPWASRAPADTAGTRLPGTAAPPAPGSPGSPTAPPCLSFPGLAGFARLCPGDQYEVCLRWFTVRLIAEESRGGQISAALYIAMNETCWHQHPKKQLIFFLHML